MYVGVIYFSFCFILFFLLYKKYSLFNILKKKNKFFVYFKNGRLFFVQTFFTLDFRFHNLNYYFYVFVLKTLYHYGLVDIMFLKQKHKNIK